MSGSARKVVGVTTALVVLITLFVSVRAYVRCCLFRSVKWDDALVFVSYALTITLSSCVLAMTSFGLGTPLADVPNDKLRRFRQLQFVTALTYVWGAATIKMSFAILYIRLLPGRFTRRLNQLLIFVLVGEAFASNMVVIFHCDPVDRMWNTNKPGRCLDLRLFYYIVFGIKLVTDICLFIQPVAPIWRLQLSMEKRVGVILMLSIGLFVCVIAIIRISTIGSLGSDVTKSLVEPLSWSVVEVCALIICAAIPAFPPFLRCFPSLSKRMGVSSFHESNEWSIFGRRPFTPRSSARSHRRSTGRHEQMSMSSRGGNAFRYNQRDTGDVSRQVIAPRQARLVIDARQSDEDDLCVYSPVI